ncbi:MAG: pyridoxal phosphate-dependent decarboxylase family protein [Terriglobales bacterium]
MRRLARQLADLAAQELIGGPGPVRDPGFAARVRAQLRRGVPDGDIAAAAGEIAAASLHLNHRRYMAQQVAAPIPAAALVESLVAALNQSLAVVRMSPAGTAVDRALLADFRRVFGFPAGAEGTLTPGGSFANLTALVAARAALQPAAWRDGVQPGRLAVIVGAQSHYSIARAAALLGLGERAVFAVPVDAAQRTLAARAPEVFAAARRAGYRRFILAATCGSTPTGSCDDLIALGAVARRYRAWLHVDAAHGGGFIFSRRLRGKLRGLEAADSLTFDPHKMLFMPLTAGAVLVRDGRRLRAAFSQYAPYLFRSLPGGAPDLAQFTLACSQRFDALKIWLTWKAYGGAFWGALVNGVCAAAWAAYEYCLRSAVLAPAHEPESNIFCFRLRRSPRGAAADRRHARLEAAVNASGEGYISSTVLQGRRVLRMVVMNPRSTAADTVAVLQAVERLAAR